MKGTKCVTLLLFLFVCVQRRTAQATAQSAIAACPTAEDGVLGMCNLTCERDDECTDDMKCCPDTCGTRSCTKIDIPVTQPPTVSGNETTPTGTPNSTAYNLTVNE